MSGTHNPARSTTSPSSGPSITTTQRTQNDAQAGTTVAATNVHSNNPLCDTDDDDLSDAPESPIFPTFSTPTNRGSTAPPPSDSDSDLSSAPTSPVWPEDPKASPSPSLYTEKDCPARPEDPKPSPNSSPNPSLCTEKDCPVRKAVRRHHMGPYLHRGKPPYTTTTIFNDSNPPNHVWESWKKIRLRDPNSTVEDDWNVLGFLRWHVDNPNTSFMGM